MLKKHILLIVSILLVASIIGGMMAQTKGKVTMENRWKKVEEYRHKQLPESALKELEQIYAQAKSDKNQTELIKAMVHMMRFKLDKNPDDAEKLIREFEQFATESTDFIEQSFLYSMTAELYFRYYTQQKYLIDRRSELIGVIPEKMSEWSTNIFAEQVMKYVQLSLVHTAELQQVSTSEYSDLLTAEDKKDEIQHTLFDLLSYRGVDLLGMFDRDKETAVIEEIYTHLIEFNQKKGDATAQLYAELRLLKHLYTPGEMIYYESLRSLQEEFKTDEAVVEVLAELANYYLTEKNDEPKSKRIAYDLATSGVKQFPKYKRIGLLKNIQMSIEEKKLSAEYKEILKPNSELKVELSSTNVAALQLEVYRVNGTAEEFLMYLDNRRNTKALFSKKTLIEQRTVKIEQDPDFNEVKSELVLQSGEYGIYEFVLKKGEKIEIVGAFTVTDFAFIQREDENKRKDLYVLDRVEGTPIADVGIKSFQLRWNGKKYDLKPISNFKTGKEGLASREEETPSNEILIFEKGADRWFSSQSQYYRFYGSSALNVDEKREKTALFTDRALYRPGQVVLLKGIVYRDVMQEVVPDRKMEIELYDANYEKIATKNVSTNRFGSFATEFVLPEGGLNGDYRISTDNGSVSIRVEEYKRPGFEVKINKPQEEIRFGENVVIQGDAKAYAGYAIADSEVRYKVIRRPHFFWWWSPVPEKIIADGLVKTDGQGAFEINFTPHKEQEGSSGLLRGDLQYYTYHIEADVTDAKGETQSGRSYFSVGDRSLFIRADVPEKIDKEKALELLVSAETLNGEAVATTVNYRLIELTTGDGYYEEDGFKEKTSERREVNKGEVVSAKKLKLDLAKANSGYYKLQLTTTDKWNREVKSEHYFVLYSKKDKQPPVKSYKWVLSGESELFPGESTTIRFGTSAANSSVLYELYAGNRLLEKQWITLSNSIQEFPIELKKEYGEGVTLMFHMVKDEQLFTEQHTVRRKQPEKKLTPTVSVFRDKLKPGEEATWMFHVPQVVGKEQQAELLTGMYDASLDAIYPHSWHFDPTYRPFYPHMPGWRFYGSNVKRGYAQFESRHQFVPEYKLRNINWFGLALDSYVYGSVFNIRGAGGRQMLSKQMAVAGDMVMEESMMMPSMDRADAAESSSDSTVQNEVDPTVQVRENFNETAFFYPQLHTDADGNVRFTFTAPESLTRWNVMMLAHTPDLYFGQETMQVITQKELMVQMNMLRFVRRSDQPVLAAQVVNLTEEEQMVQVRLEVIDPERDKTVQLFESDTPLLIPAGGSKAVEWQLDALTTLDLAVIKVVVANDYFSDGEQKYLPVLPDKVLVTESQTLTMRPNQTRTFNFENFTKSFEKVETQNYSVEFTANPTWYAVQALPTLADPQNKSTIDYLTAYYANTLAAFIANSNPKLKSTFDRWKNAPGSQEVLLSNLEKNRELKAMLLEETPWVTDAKDESEQKRQIALLFDLNLQSSKTQQQFDKLMELQTPEGGFTWYPGMRPNRYITQEVLLNLARLHKMIGQERNSQEDEVVRRALDWLDRELARDFEELKKRNKNYRTQQVIGDLQLFYLHMRSEYPDVEVVKTSLPAYEFYTAQSEKYWTSWSLYGKAMMAVVAKRNGKDRVAQDILKSLKENALNDDELGMYWAKNRAGWWWHERPVATQTAIIEAVGEIEGEVADLDEMKIWLLKQKQAQRWDSPIATVNAIYALLHYGDNWLESTGEVQIEVGSKLLEPTTKEAGSGYFKETVTLQELSQESGKIAVSTTGGNTIGWGAAYWQFFQNLDEITSAGKEIQITKNLFVERIIDGKKSIVPLNQSEAKKGDKLITRLVLTTDRDMEYVVLKDLRAAALEPVEQLSGYRYSDGAGYYTTIKDASTQYFFDYLRKGTYVFEHESWINNSGTFTSGITTVQCLYAPEFVAHTGGDRIEVK